MSSHLLMSEERTDMTLKVPHNGYTWRFPAHSLFLQTKSKKLKEMIEDRGDENPLTLPLIGFHPKSVITILDFFYTGNLPTRITPDLLLAAEKLELETLINHCENELLPRLRVSEACDVLESFENQQETKQNCNIKRVCYDIIERHAYRVFSSDLILGLSRKVLIKLLKSDDLNVPGEQNIFWGVWRWGRQNCSKNNRRLTEEVIAHHIDDLLVLMRRNGFREIESIPSKAQDRFNRCLPRRCRYKAPHDSLEQSTTWRACCSWLDLVEEVNGELGHLCIQISFSTRVMLVGLSLEMVASEQPKAMLRIFRESDGKEMLRQRVDCFRCVPNRKLSRNADKEPESWQEAEVILLEPLLLPGKTIYSVYLTSGIQSALLPRALCNPPFQLMGSTYVTRHAQDEVAVRELYLVPDMEATWGPVESS